ncbi:MAG: hypothetical protein ACREE6_13080, partial [Limisphaerales bacterium]
MKTTRSLIVNTKTVRALMSVLGVAFAMSTAYSQTAYTWIGTTYGGNGTNFATAANWTTNGTTAAITLPTGANGDTAQWDG